MEREGGEEERTIIYIALGLPPFSFVWPLLQRTFMPCQSSYTRGFQNNQPGFPGSRRLQPNGMGGDPAVSNLGIC